MLDLRSLDPARQTADRRVALAIGYGALGSMTFAAVAAGGGGRALALGVVLALAGLPWVFAFSGRWRLLDDAIARRAVRVARRSRRRLGDRAGRAARCWRCCSRWRSGCPGALALLASSPARPATPPRCRLVEQRYERLILLDLTVLEQRFERIIDTRTSLAAPRS